MSFNVVEGTQQRFTYLKPFSFGNNRDTRYATLHPVEVRDGKPEIGAGVPMTQDSLREMRVHSGGAAALLVEASCRRMCWQAW